MARDPDGEHEMGAGGKLTKRSLRSRVPASPYARPAAAAAAAEKSKGGWLSKLLVKPAARILPSLFSSSYSSQQVEQPQDQAQDQAEPLSETGPEHGNVSTLSSDNQLLVPKDSGGDPAGNACSDHGISEIEQKLQQKKFSREETEHLIELLRSRTTDLPDEDGHGTGLKLEAPKVRLEHKGLRISAKEDCRVRFDCGTLQKSRDHFQDKGDDVSTSAIEIAKAYMEGRVSTPAYDYEAGRLRNDKSSFCTDNVAPGSSFTPIAKSPICWPGAIMQNDQNYFTPQRSSGVRYPRTPYSGALFPKSSSKFQLQDNSGRPNRSSAVRSSAYVSGSNMKTATRTNYITENGFAPVSPVYHVHQRSTATPFRGAGPSSLATPFSLRSKIDASIGTSSESDLYEVQQADVMDRASRFSTGSTPVHPQSSAMARKILQHLDTSVPSPKEKLLEINLARQRVPPKPVNLAMEGQHTKSDASVSGKHKIVSQETVDAQKVLPATSMTTSSDKDRLSSFAQTRNQGMSTFGEGTTTASSAMLQATEATSLRPAKLYQKRKTSDNGFSFTFPVSSAPAAFSETPPTPTMGSPSAASNSMLDAGNGSVPSFSFGSTNSGDRLVFSFGSPVSSSNDDTTAPTFKFGDEKETRISFKPIGGDAICY